MNTEKPEVIPKNEMVVGRDTESLPMPIMDRLLQAASNGMDLATVERFMALAERNESREAEKAYNASYADYKKNIPTVKPDEKGKIKTKSGFVIEWDYVSLGKLSAEIAKAMAPFGLSFDWDTEQNGPTITVSCFVRHGLGHFRKVSLSCGPDTSGDKSPIHAIKSTITYLKKATLEMASGVSMSEHDDDGQGAGSVTPPPKRERKQPENVTPYQKGGKPPEQKTAERKPGDGGEVQKDRVIVESWIKAIDGHIVNSTSAALKEGWEKQILPSLPRFPADQRNELEITYKDTMKALLEKEGVKS